MTDQALSLRLVPGAPERTHAEELALVESYRRLADVFHDVLAEQSLDALLDRVADALAELIPYDSPTTYAAEGAFDTDEFELARRFGDAAALALDNAQIRARLEHQAQTDPLTGLYNHRMFHERLRIALTAASRSHNAVSVLMLDIDDFKRVHDVYGHGSGDENLRALAETVKAALRASEVVSRLGGEEFAIVMTSRDPEDAERLARRLVEHVNATAFEPAGKITISVGLARGPEHAMNPRELIACAEAAMMTAK